MPLPDDLALPDLGSPAVGAPYGPSTPPPDLRAGLKLRDQIDSVHTLGHPAAMVGQDRMPCTQ